jgi:uncharacterized membrane protein YgcG
VYGSGDAYSNNLENNPQVATFHSSGFTGGSSLVMPWKLNGNASISILDFTERQPLVPGETTSNNRQLNLNLNRSLKRHSLRLSYTGMNLNANDVPQVERFLEMEDIFTWKRWVIGQAIREQNTRTTQDVNTLFYRGSLQTTFKRVSVYGYFEKGNDLVNRSVFSTNAYSSEVAGISAPLLKGWNFHVEAFRNGLLTALNPENVFLFGNSGLGLNSQLSATNQWSVYLRISKHFHWGKQFPGGLSLDEYAAKSAPLVGTVQGLVVEQSLAGPRPAPNVAVSLDQYRSVVTDALGHYLFADVAEGLHEVGLNMEQLPTDYEPGTLAKGTVLVQPRAVVRADFNVTPLTMFSGRIVAPTGVPVANVLIRVAGTNRYTTPYEDGSFCFYDLREGDYQVSVDTQTVPEGYLLASPATLNVSVRSKTVAPSVVFELKSKPEPVKPVREILQQEIHVGGQSGASPQHDSASGRTGTGTPSGSNKSNSAGKGHAGGHGSSGNGTRNGGSKRGGGAS